MSASAKKIVRLSTNAERVHALDSNYRSWFHRAGEVAGCEMKVLPGYDVLTTPYPMPLYNVAMVTNHIWAAESLAELAAHFTAKRLPYRIYAGEATKTAERLVARAQAMPVKYPCLAASLVGREAQIAEMKSRARGDVRRATCAQDIAAWAHLVGESFGIPGAFVRFLAGVGMVHGVAEDSAFPLFVAYEADKPVACSSVYFAADAAAIYCVGTLPEARARGFASAVTVAAVEEVLRRGYEWVGGCASPMGLPVYQRLGAEAVGEVLEMYPPLPANK